MIEHAKYELDLILEQCENEEEKKLQGVINQNILDIIEVFASQGHSGFTANYTINALTKLLKFQFLTPLTGEDKEWLEVGEGVFQNKRCSSIFKDKDRFDGKPCYIEGRLFSDDGKNWYIRGGGESSVIVEFPLIKLPEPIRVITKEIDS